MASPVVPSQTSGKLATQQEAAVLSMLSLDLGKTAWLGSNTEWSRGQSRPH